MKIRKICFGALIGLLVLSVAVLTFCNYRLRQSEEHLARCAEYCVGRFDTLMADLPGYLDNYLETGDKASCVRILETVKQVREAYTQLEFYTDNGQPIDRGIEFGLRGIVATFDAFYAADEDPPQREEYAYRVKAYLETMREVWEEHRKDYVEAQDERWDVRQSICRALREELEESLAESHESMWLGL